MNHLLIFILFIALTFKIFASDIPESPRSKKAITKTILKLTKELAAKKLQLGQPIFIRIFKKENILELWINKNKTFHLFKTYQIQKYSGTLGPKTKEGDMQAPEGFYFVIPSRLNPDSRFHLSFNLGYPNTYDRAHNYTGSALMVHGSNVSIGCYAMGNPAIEEIYTLAHMAFKNGQKFFRVHIFPFHLTPTNLKQYKNSKWLNFWNNLKQGYDWFNKYKQPPNVKCYNKKYIFNKAEN